MKRKQPKPAPQPRKREYCLGCDRWYDIITTMVGDERHDGCCCYTYERSLCEEYTP